MLAVVLMSVDESISLHENLGSVVGRRLGLGGWFHFAWVVPGLAFVVGFGLYMVPLLVRLPPRERFRVTLAGALFVCGAPGMDIVAGRFLALGDLAFVMLEETLEMLSVSIFVYALLEHLAGARGLLTLSLEPGEAPRLRAAALGEVEKAVRERAG